MRKMNVRLIYPDAEGRSLWRRNRLLFLRGAFLTAAYLCLLINLLTEGIPWSLLVIGGLAVVWIAAVYRPQVENTAIKKLCDVLIAVCLYLLLLDSVLGGGWGYLVVPIVFFADLALIGAYFLVFFKKQRRNFLPLLELLVAGLVSALCSLIAARRPEWQLSVLGAVSLGIMILSVALFRKPLMEEIKKKFHTR